MIIFIKEMSWVYLILWAFGIYWITLSLLAFLHCRKMFKRYAKHGKIEHPDPKWEGFIRDDFEKWDRSKILLGCFTKLPGKFLLFATFITGCVIILYAQSKAGLSPRFVKIAKGYLAVSKTIFHYAFIGFEEGFQSRDIDTPIVISNHVNFLDIYILLLSVGPLSFMAKREVQKYPIIGSCADGLFSLYVDRKSADSRSNLMNQVQKRIADFNNKEATAYPLVIFPEGTTSNGKGILAFKMGAFETKSPISAFCLSYQSSGQCSISMDEITQLDSIILVGTTHMKVKVEKVNLQAKEGQSGEEYMHRSEELYRQRYGLKLYEGGYRDKQSLKQFRLKGGSKDS